MSRGLRTALLLCLLGGVLLLGAAGATWTTVVAEGRAPLPDSTVDVPGSDLVPGLRALALLGLAGVPALLATRRWGRVAVGALLASAGAAAVVVVARVLGDFVLRISGTASYGDALPLPDGGTTGFVAVVPPPDADPTVWPYAAVLGGVLLAAGGLVAVARGRAWPALGARYEAPASRATTAAPAAGDPAPVTEKSTWEALDRGEDPTR